MEYAMKLAEDTKTGQFSRQSHAIRSEYAKLKLLAEQNMTSEGFEHTPLDAPPRLASLVSWLDFLSAFSIFLFPILMIWGYYALTGNYMEFGHG